MVKTISVETLKEKIKLNEDFLFIDVREPFERESGFIENDINIPLAQLSYDTLPSTDKPIIIYCRSGVRSFNACELLLAQNENLNVFNLVGGFLAWSAYNNEPIGNATCSLNEEEAQCISTKKPCGMVSMALIGASIFLGFTVSAMFYIIALLGGIWFIMKNMKSNCTITKTMEKICGKKK
jgi:rhodanese-related sulfurtransferase